MKKTAFFCVMLLGILPFCVKAQPGSPFYFMKISASQSSWSNPAFIAPYKFSATVPVVGGLHLQLENNFLAWNRIFSRDSRDSLHLTADNLLGAMGLKSRIMLSAHADVVNFTWRRGQNNYSVGAYAHGDLQVVLDKASLAFLLQGPGAHEGKNNLKNNTLDINSYVGLYFGYSRQISRKLSVGGRFKLLQGLWNLHTSDLDLMVDIQNADMENPEIVPETYAVKLDGKIKTNLPFSDLSLGPLDLYPFQNIGAAFDFGVSYKFKKGWEVAASVSDLGFIFWGDDNAGAYSSKAKNPYVLSGMGIDDVKIGMDNILDWVKGELTEAIDSLKMQKAEGGYVRATPVNFSVALSYTLRDKWCFGAVFRALAYSSYFAPEGILSCTWTPTPNFSLCVSNTFSSSGFLNLGAGFVVNAGALQFHLGVDRMSSFNVAGMRTVCVDFGLNLVFGKSAYDFYTGK